MKKTKSQDLTAKNTLMGCTTALAFTHAIAMAQGPEETVYKCVGSGGSITYQAAACDDAHEEQRFTVTGDSESNREAAETLQRRVKATKAERDRAELRQELERRSAAAQSKAAAAAAPPPEPVRCPATAERPGPDNAIWGTASNGKPMVVGFNKPSSETYLKNAGKWPHGCSYTYAPKRRIWPLIPSPPEK